MSGRTALLLLLATLGALLGTHHALAAPAPEPPPIQVEIVPATTYAAVDRVGAYAGLAADYPRLLAWVRAAGLVLAGPAEGLYQDDPLAVAVGRLRSSACFPVLDRPLASLPGPSGGIALRRLPARLVAHTLHVGPYDQVRPTYERLQRALPQLGLRYVGPMREVYLDDPAVTAPQDLRTTVSLVVEPTAKTDVGLYVGPGADGPGLRSLAQTLFAARISFRPLEPAMFRDGSLGKACRAVLVPGGWAPDALGALGPEGVRGLREFVRAGGGYVGVCAGAYLATRSIVWEGETSAYPLGLFEGSATGPLAAVAPWPATALTPLALEGTHPVVAGLSGTRTALYQGGPVFVGEQDSVSVLARFSVGGGAALVALTTGQGRVVLSSAHLEGRLDESASAAAPTPWPEGQDPEPDRDLLARSVLWVLRRDPSAPR